jgi:hypothetical protein
MCCRGNHHNDGNQNKKIAQKGKNNMEAFMSDLTNTEVNNMLAQSIKNNRRGGGGRGKSSSPSQLDLLSFEGLKFIVTESKKSENHVSVQDITIIGSEFFRVENADLTLKKKMESAKSISKVTVVDYEVELSTGNVVRYSELLEMPVEEVKSLVQNVVGYSRVYTKNEQFACEYPLSDVVNTKDGSAKPYELAYILAPWKLFIETCEKFANIQ